MSQELINVLTIFVLPSVVGLVLRLSLFKFKKGYIVTIISASAGAALCVAFLTISTHGDEGLGLMFIMSLLALLGTLVGGLIVLIARKIKSRKN